MTACASSSESSSSTTSGTRSRGPPGRCTSNPRCSRCSATCRQPRPGGVEGGAARRDLGRPVRVGVGAHVTDQGRPEGGGRRRAGAARHQDGPRRGYQLVADVRVDAGSIRRSLPRLRNAPIGRDHDIASVIERIRAAPLLTITGPGGIGKTTVALAVADRLQAEYADGVVFVDLSPVPAPGGRDESRGRGRRRGGRRLGDDRGLGRPPGQPAGPARARQLRARARAGRPHSSTG